jgi:thioredoxin-like negative regulator of GroEL
MGYDLYVDGECVDGLGSASGWDAAATFIEKYTAPNTPLRRLAEEGETNQPRQAARMLADLIQQHKMRQDIRITLVLLNRWLLKSQHDVMISDGIEYED